MTATPITQFVPEHTIVEYARTKSGAPVGVVVATVCTDEKGKKFARLGWSKTKVSWGDKFNKQRGLEIAVARALNGSEALVPFTIADTYENILNRSRVYFKDMEVIANQIAAPVRDNLPPSVFGFTETN